MTIIQIKIDVDMRIIAGRYKNRLIHSPKGEQTRPSSGMLREALFNICQDTIEDCRFLDLFAGTGAIGLEALSRGAKDATFIDNDKRCITAIEKNIANFEVNNVCQIFFSDVLKTLERMIKNDNVKFDMIFADPPYATEVQIHHEKMKISQAILLSIDNSNLLAPNGSLFIEDSAESLSSIEAIPLKKLKLSSSRRYGRSMLYHWTNL